MFNNYKVINEQSNQDCGNLSLPNLPFNKNDLEPVISANTFDFHHGKHHNAYVTKLKELIVGTDFENETLESVIIQTNGDSSKAGIFNNAAQVWNHTFFWHSIVKNGGGKPNGDVLNRIERDFGSYENFTKDFIANGVGQFGSGWVWLVEDKAGKLSIVKTPNAETPITKGLNPLITCDVWEHAYYLDFQNKRPDFLTAFLEKLVNWKFANENLKVK